MACPAFYEGRPPTGTTLDMFRNCHVLRRKRPTLSGYRFITDVSRFAGNERI
jgi:hypothetical protein